MKRGRGKFASRARYRAVTESFMCPRCYTRVPAAEAGRFYCLKCEAEVLCRAHEKLDARRSQP